MFSHTLTSQYRMCTYMLYAHIIVYRYIYIYICMNFSGVIENIYLKTKNLTASRFNPDQLPVQSILKTVSFVYGTNSEMLEIQLHIVLHCFFSCCNCACGTIFDGFCDNRFLQIFLSLDLGLYTHFWPAYLCLRFAVTTENDKKLSLNRPNANTCTLIQRKRQFTENTIRGKYISHRNRDYSLKPTIHRKRLFVKIHQR